MQGACRDYCHCGGAVDSEFKVNILKLVVGPPPFKCELAIFLFFFGTLIATCLTQVDL